jgi:hypothetical protein
MAIVLLYIALKIDFKTIQAVYLYLNTGALWSNHCCSGKTTSMTHSERVFLALSIQHAMRMCGICGLSGSTVFFRMFSLTRDFWKKSYRK